MARSKRTADSGYLSSPLPRVFAHRGLAIDTPENTLLAFAKAIALGVGYVETDVHASSDGVAMISHDPDLMRMTGRDVRIEQLTSAELQRIDLGEGQTFCTLAAALDAFPETRFNIDIKAMGAAAPTVSAIKKANAAQRVMIGSFSNERRLAVVTQLPDVATSVSPPNVVAAAYAASIGATALVRRVVRGSDALQIPEKILGVSTVSRRAISTFHAVGIEVHIWTVNDAATMERLLDAGVDGIMSDRADIAMDVVSRRRKL
jgi:glycerophosphoryl diester phosphodiesterase